ncbi:MAG: DNA repair protein RecO [Verrucomicrobiae bacterium]|nr:DNA repair protein RecO [Verrucomicrobiae bacterium]MCB1234928.1 DNA repair protein RecO [Verrucomicrobiae bacterium]MCP5541802.1 DNA repair protein RecO [Akkermansiaceae bacterium]
MPVTATLLRRIPLTETSLIVHWCGADCGLVKTVAKGARRPKSPFAGKLDLFFRCEIEIVPAKKGDLHILKDLAVLDSRLGIRSDYTRTLAAAYFVRLIEAVTEPETPIPDLADLLDRALGFLEKSPCDLRAVRHFERQLAARLGLMEEEQDGRRSPIDTIAETFGAIPKQRAELLERLR